VLVKTAAKEPPGAVRVLFTGSVVAEINAPKGGINFEDINNENGGSAQLKYGQSKVGDIFLAAEFARRNSATGEGVVFAVSSPSVTLGTHSIYLHARERAVLILV
jgi:retinol dehydrogenase 12